MEYINHKDFHLQDTIVLLGNFDGLHLGHQQFDRSGENISSTKDATHCCIFFLSSPAYGADIPTDPNNFKQGTKKNKC